jgi:hypothetical protein
MRYRTNLRKSGSDLCKHLNSKQQLVITLRNTPLILVFGAKNDD